MTISTSESFRWEGYDLNQSIDTLFNLDKILDLDSAMSAYDVTIGTKISAHASYGFGKSRTFKKRCTYYPHNVSVFFLQGFRNYLNTSATPLLSLGYSYRYKNVINAGTNVSVGGNIGFGLGAHLNFSLGPLQMGLASNSLVGLVNRYMARSLDLQLFSSISF